MKNYNEIVKDAISTDKVTAGILNREQSKKFLKQAMESSPIGSLIRHEMRTSRVGEIDKIGVQSRIIRKKTENADDNYRGTTKFSKVEYSTKAVRLPWEITEETLKENIEGEGLESTITSLMSAQVGLDVLDLGFNGNTATLSSDPDYDFLKINDGWIKKLEGAHVVDRSTVDAGAMSVGVYYSALKALPNKYNNGKLKWLMSPKRKQEWEQYIIDKKITTGGGTTDGLINNPASIEAVAVPSLPDGIIILTDPKNLVMVNTYEVKIRKTTEGKEAIFEDKRFYVIHLDFDSIIEELDGAVLVKGLATV